MCQDADSNHHIKPSSRGGSNEDENTCMIPSAFHEALHILFHNMTPQEQLKFVQEFNRIARKVDELDGRDLYELRHAIMDGPLPRNDWSPFDE